MRVTVRKGFRPKVLFPFVRFDIYRIRVTSVSSGLVGCVQNIMWIRQMPLTNAGNFSELPWLEGYRYSEKALTLLEAVKKLACPNSLIFYYLHQQTSV